MFKKYKLDNKFALITGAGGLLGFEHSHALLEAGANVVLTDISLSNLNKNYLRLRRLFKNSLILKRKMDVTNEESVKKCQKFLGGKKIFISILINNASVNPTNNKLKSLFLEKYNLSVFDAKTGPRAKIGSPLSSRGVPLPPSI